MTTQAAMGETNPTPNTCVECERLRSVNADLIFACESVLNGWYSYLPGHITAVVQNALDKAKKGAGNETLP